MGDTSKPSDTAFQSTDEFSDPPSDPSGTPTVRMPRSPRAIEDLRGTSIAHFRLVDIIGSGGMGVVYRAEDEKLQRRVAIKLLRAKPFAEADARSRFLDEARAAAAVSHANVAAVYEVGEDSGRVYIAMELVEGQSLRARLVALPPLDEALRLALQIARGLARAHDKGVLHRDLKPDNVMVDADGQVKILDFGLSKRFLPLEEQGLVAADGSLPVGRVGQVMGTPGYMSPEQALGLEVDQRTDIYSFGVILYELATCTQLFSGEALEQVAAGMADETIEPPSHRNARVGTDLEAIILRCLARRPADRFASARDVCAALEGLGVTGRSEMPPPDEAAGLAATLISPPWPARDMSLGTVTLLQIDVAGLDRLVELLGDRAAEAIVRQRGLVRRAVGAHGGHFVDSATMSGDRSSGARGSLAAFPSARQAVLAAIALHAAHREEHWPGDISIVVRMGLHTGEPRLVKGRYVGLDVHRTIRIAAAASAGQVLLSASTWEQVRQADLGGVTGRDIGTHRLEELRYPEHLFALVMAGVSSGETPFASAHRPSNLPAQATAFVGRERQLREVCALVRRADARLVTLTGPGGTGKTRLSIEVARALENEFPAGVYQIQLAPVSDPALVPALVAETVGVPERPGRPALEAIKAAIGHGCMLLVLDNFEQIIAAAPALAELLAACPNLKILATSREPLKLRFEREYPVPPLELPAGHEGDVLSCESARLFVDRLRDVRPDFAVTAETTPHIAAICTRLEGLPLAIELAASRMKMLTLPSLLERLRDRLGFLSGDARDREARHRTLRATIAWSYQLLDEVDRVLFRRVAVFAGGFDIETAEAVCVLPSDASLDVFDRLASLSDKSLLLRVEVEGEPRLDMLQTIREYALGELRATPEAEILRARHAAHFVALAEALGPSLMGAEQRRSTGRLLTEAQNIRAALSWAVEQPAPEHTLRLLRGLLWFWLMHGHLTEAREWMMRALAQTRALGPTRERAEVLEIAALGASISGDLAWALACADEGIAIWRGHGDMAGAARTQIVLGLSGFALGKDPDGPRLVEQALAACRASGDAFGAALALNVLGELTRATGRLAEARAAYEEAIRLFRQTGNIVFPSLLAVNLVHCHLHDGNWRAAAALLAETLEMGMGFNYPLHISYYLASMACVAVVRGRPLDGIRLFGAFEGLNASLGAEVQPQDQAEFNGYIEAAKRALGEAVVAEEWKRGASWTRDQAIAATLALRS
jgi:predicted ATPase/class 3 adenylate cyclase/tRNA A-37 threonylcarbamoyl transferase component Bud32